MGMVVERVDGGLFELPDALALDAGEVALEYPSLLIPDRHGRRVVEDMRTASPRTLTISGAMDGISPEDADALWADLTTILMGGGALKLRRSLSSGLYIVCEPRELHRDYHRGRHGGTLFTIRVLLDAHDPFWYHTAPVGLLHTTAASGETWTVNHPGTYRRQPITARVYPASGTLTNPSLEVVSSGSVATFTGMVGPDQVLILDGLRRMAWLEDWSGANLDPTGGPVVTNVTGMTGALFQADGLMARPGDNVLRYSDDAASSHQAHVYVEFIPRSW